MKTDKKLENAVLVGDLALTKSLIENGSNSEGIDRYGRTIISDAIVKGSIDIVSVLCEANANVNAKDNEERTPLHFAAINNQLEIAKILVEFGAIIDARDKYGNTPLANAVFYSQGYPDLILFLKDIGANPDSRNNYDMSPRELAETSDNFKFPDIFK